jgi:flavin-binding protein dodecin
MFKWYASYRLGNVARMGVLRKTWISDTIHSESQRRDHKWRKRLLRWWETSQESFAKAAENAVAEAAKTVRGLKWARVAELEMELDGKKIAQYRTTTKIYFDIEE